MNRKVNVSLTRFVCTDFSQPQLPVLGDRMSLPFWYREHIVREEENFLSPSRVLLAGLRIKLT